MNKSILENWEEECRNGYAHMSPKLQQAFEKLIPLVKDLLQAQREKDAELLGEDDEQGCTCKQRILNQKGNE